MNILVCATSNASDQPAHMRSLTRAVATSVPDTYRLRRSEVCEQQRRRPSCAYAQSDRRLYYSPIIIKANSLEN